jgi:sugar O-acyltransferase (sialic acid O-acetyltransferase NeuD family)
MRDAILKLEEVRLMERILIMGGGGFGREIFGYIKNDISSDRLPKNLQIGVLDDSKNCELISNNPDALYFGSLENYVPNGTESIIIAIGSTSGRLKLFNITKEKRIAFFTYIHPSALVMPDATLGEGVIICPNAVINAGAKIEDNVAINVFSSVGHGCTVGSHSVLSPYSAMNGDSSIGSRTFMGTRATIFPKVSVGCECIVDSHSAVRKSVGDNMIISVRGEYIELKNRFIKS